MAVTRAQFELEALRVRFPRTVDELLAVEDGEAHLRRVWEIEQRWERFRRDPSAFEKVLFPGGGAESVEDDFDIIYAGGTLGLLHAAVMATCYGRKVLVFDAHKVAHTHRDWNISDEELSEFVKAGLFTRDEMEDAIVNRYKTGFVKFFDGTSEIKAPPLYMEKVLDVAVDADALLTLALKKLEAAGGVSIDGLRFERAALAKSGIVVECVAPDGRKRDFSAKLFIDATGTNSPASRQLNRGQSITHVCPTVGTVAKGFVRGTAEDEVDFTIGEILVSTEDCTKGRQLIWEGFAGSPQKDEYTTYLFFYDSVDSPADKSLFVLFEEYFEKLPTYKKPSEKWRIVKPVYGYIPSIHHKQWSNAKRTAADRVLLIGDAAGLSSPLTFCGFGSHVRNLRRLTSRTEEALRTNKLDEASLCDINAYEANVSQMASLAEFMRPMEKSEAGVVNETMNAVMMTLSRLDKDIRRQMFQDRVTFKSFRQVLQGTAMLYPKVFKLMFEHLGVKGAFWWIANIVESAWKERNR